MYINQDISYDYDDLIKEFEKDVAAFHYKPTDTVYVDRDKPIKVFKYLEYSPIIDYQFLDSDETEDDLDPRANFWVKSTVSDMMLELSDMNREL